MTTLRFFLLLPILIMSGCIPDELSEAGKCFYRENYAGTINKINLFLDKQGDITDVQEKSYRAIALFYRGLSKRACMILRVGRSKNDYMKFGSLRLSDHSICDFTIEEIVGEYSMAKRLKSDLVCADFHIGLEYVLCGQFEKAATFLSQFESAVSSGFIPNIEKQFDGEFILQKSQRLANFLLREIATRHAKTTDICLEERVLSFYRDTLFRKSKHHELHNIQLLTRKYSVAHFKFLLESVNLESDYDYIGKNIECGIDYLTLRGNVGGDFDLVTKKLNDNGFGEWRRCEYSSGIKLVSKMGVCVFEGQDHVPILVCIKRVDFCRVLLVIYSFERQCLYCVVCKEDSPSFQCITNRMNL